MPSKPVKGQCESASLVYTEQGLQVWHSKLGFYWLEPCQGIRSLYYETLEETLADMQNPKSAAG